MTRNPHKLRSGSRIKCGMTLKCVSLVSNIYSMIYSPNKLKDIPHLPGIYKFYSSSGEILYVGKAINLKIRISSYFKDNLKEQRKVNMVSQIKQIEIIPVSSEFEALLLEAKLINKYKPKYNVLLKDDRHYIYIQITKDEFPRILYARKTDTGGYFFGPFPSSKIVKELLSYLRTIFPFCTQKLNSKRGCFYSHIGLCKPCPAEIRKETGVTYSTLKKLYKQNVITIKRIFEGKIGEVRLLLTKEMNNNSDKREYEKAAILRDKIRAMDYMLNQRNRADSYIEDPKFLETIVKKEQEELLFILKQYFPRIQKLTHLECFDISNISGKLATGSMVTFLNGSSDKGLYRKFRIKFVHKPNDFEMLAEILTRRLRHFEWKLPDLIIIDGGRPQLMALKKVLNTLNIEIPMIGLAKRYEEIVVPNGLNYLKIKLKENSPALHLVKRIRDEAHRFAHAYHLHLRLKNLLGHA